jgi:transposase
MDRQMKEALREAVIDIQAALGLPNGEFAERLGVSAGAVTRWLKDVDDERFRTPSRAREIGALLRVAPPAQQAQVLRAIEATNDVEEFATELLVELAEVPLSRCGVAPSS